MWGLHLSTRFSMCLSRCFISETTEWISIKCYTALNYRMNSILACSWLRRYATSRKVEGSSTDEMTFFQFT
jgi:hypothetical protein